MWANRSTPTADTATAAGRIQRDAARIDLAPTDTPSLVGDHRENVDVVRVAMRHAPIADHISPVARSVEQRE
jgi:hypothetical protein